MLHKLCQQSLLTTCQEPLLLSMGDGYCLHFSGWTDKPKMIDQ